jgi:hypothetical protein
MRPVDPGVVEELVARKFHIVTCPYGREASRVLSPIVRDVS